MQTTASYKSMLKDILKNQIQHLIDQLSDVGEESVLLTACLTESNHDNLPVGSHLGRSFIQVRAEYHTAFKDFCVQSVQGDVSKLEDKPPEYSLTQQRVAKRPLSTNGFGDATAIISENTSGAEVKRARTDFSRSTIHETKDLPQTPNKLITNESETDSPKGQHKCTMCSYASKFKANVSRHERSIHGLKMEGATTPSVQYACTLCQYKSLYRSNLMRHEKTVHKLESSNMDLENRQIPMDLMEDVDMYQQGLESQTEDSQGSDFSYTEPSEATAVHGHICSYCQQVCLTIQNLREHIESVHLGSDRFACENCGKKFDSIVTLQEHMSVVHGGRKHFEKCACGKTFQYRASLMRHEKRCTFGKNAQDAENCDGSSQKNLSQGTGLQDGDTNTDQQGTSVHDGNVQEQGTSLQDGNTDQQGTGVNDGNVQQQGTRHEYSNQGINQNNMNVESSQLGIDVMSEQHEDVNTGTKVETSHGAFGLGLDVQQGIVGNLSGSLGNHGEGENDGNPGQGSFISGFHLMSSQDNS